MRYLLHITLLFLLHGCNILIKHSKDEFPKINIQELNSFQHIDVLKTEGYFFCGEFSIFVDNRKKINKIEHLSFKQEQEIKKFINDNYGNLSKGFILCSDTNTSNKGWQEEFETHLTFNYLYVGVLSKDSCK